MLRHEPDLAPRIRIVSTTELAPIPFLVAAPTCPDGIVSALQGVLAKFGETPACESLRDRLCLEAFVPVTTDDYSLMTRWDTEARVAGYREPG